MTRPILIGLLSCFTLSAGICTDDRPKPRHEIRLLAGYSPESPTLIGTARNFKMTLVEAGYSYRCWDFKKVGVSYSASIMPLVLFHAPSIGYIFDPGPNGQGGFLPSGSVIGPPATIPVTSIISSLPSFGFLPARSTYGFGVMPLGFQFDFIRDRRLHPIAEINGGIVASRDPVPYSFENATGLNFLFNFGGGLRWHHAEGQAITAGYRFVHVSNAGTSAYNPGLDNSLFYLSYSFLR